MPTFTPETTDHEEVLLILPVLDIATNGWADETFTCKQAIPTRTILDLQNVEDDVVDMPRFVSLWAMVLDAGSLARMTEILDPPDELAFAFNMKHLNQALEWVAGELIGVDEDGVDDPA